MMDPTALRALALQVLEDHKAETIVSLDVRDMTAVADYFIVCTGRSAQHSQTLARHLVEHSKKQGHQPVGVEGETQGDWILIDLGDVIVHVMLEKTRAFYSLEKLWSVSETMKGEGREQN